MAVNLTSQFKGIGQYIVVGSDDDLESFEGLAGRLEAIGIKKGELSKNEKLADVYGTLFKKMFPVDLDDEDDEDDDDDKVVLCLF